MILPVFITVISDHDKPQPPGCLLDERIPAVLTALFTRELNADEVISQIARITGWKPSSGDLKEVLKALGGLQSTVSPEHSQDDGEQARLKAARVKMQNLI
ncbi:stability protein [Escherichia coli]